jgi:hypothetical protein
MTLANVAVSSTNGDITINTVRAGLGNASVSSNTAFGASALNANTSGSSNTALGQNALLSNTTGLRTTAIGHNAGYTQVSADSNVFIGDYSGYQVTGNYNNSVGRNALYSACTGASNNAFGYSALFSNTSGANNVAIGDNALQANTTASDNTAVGYQALYNNVTGTGLTAIGKGAALASTGNYNTIVGWRTGEAITSGAGNTIVGALAGSLSTGSQNTFIGGPVIGVSNGCASAMTTGSKNTIIGNYNGNNGGVDIRTLSNFIVLSDGDGNPRMVYEGDNNVWSAPQIYNSTTGVGANVYVGSTGRLYRSTSSLKYKTNVQTATFGLVDVLKLRAVTYKGNGLDDSDKTYAGLIAEEVHEAGLTQFVQYADDGTPDALSYGNMVSLCVKAIQELKAINDQQAETINALTARIVALEAK